MELSQTLSVVIEQKIFGFRLEQTKLPWAPRSSSSKLILCQKSQQFVSSQKRGEHEDGKVKGSHPRSGAEQKGSSVPFTALHDSSQTLLLEAHPL